jgi:hypothetical protein
MTTNILIPIPRGIKNHANYKAKRTIQDILDLIRNRPTHDAAGFPILKDSARTSLKRLFKERKPFPYKKRPRTRMVYGIFDHNLRPVSVVATKAEALRMLQQDSIKSTFFGKKLSSANGKIVELSAGSTVVRIPTIKGKRCSINTELYNIKPSNPDFGSLHRVATKRCSTCPRINSATEERCGCSLMAYLKDQTPGWVYQTDHQLLMKRHRDRKRTNQIEISLDDLIE